MVSFSELTTKRNRLTQALTMMADCQKEMQRTREEGHFNAGMAAAWAGVLLATDIIKNGMSAGNKEAALGFAAIDKGVEQANKLLVAFKAAPIARKGDALKSLDPNLQKVSGMAQQVRDAQGYLKKLKINPTANTGTLITIALDMVDDTLLMLQAGQDQTRLWNSNSAAIMKVYGQMDKVKAAQKKVDAEIQRWLLAFDKFERTA